MRLSSSGTNFSRTQAPRGLGDVLIARHVPGDVVLKIRAVGHVVVDVEIGVPRVEQLAATRASPACPP